MKFATKPHCTVENVFRLKLTWPNLTYYYWLNSNKNLYFVHISDNPVVSLGRDSGNAVQSFMKFANETSLHGWKYVQTSSPLERFCWLVLLIVALITASVLVYLAVSDFLSHSVSTNMDSLSTPYDNLYFPAITVSSYNLSFRRNNSGDLTGYFSYCGCPSNCKYLGQT